ncbi:hypothetical protein TRFO_15246 [Tritrichomonas foetus]|uniref:Uncharacterized protein n=1 Tax=Tritrichomonas foetus TaxID=1144522 RepID=A0A1J4KY06_9EUKA|nr:hypothetical protein TRFO_15246 [Tritrichomonas foetus]|eukprot:OHT14445.1 hypothetical protein TRFO_15246 [Tritrichomonas foetus]
MKGMGAFARLNANNDPYIDSIADQVITFNEHASQLIAGIADFGELFSKDENEKYKELNIFSDQDEVGKETASLFITKETAKLKNTNSMRKSTVAANSKMTNSQILSSKVSRTSYPHRKKNLTWEKVKDYLKWHKNEMQDYYNAICQRLSKEIDYLDFDNYFPLCREILKFFTNYAKIVHMTKKFALHQQFLSKTDLIRLVSPFIDRITPFLQSYFNKKFNWSLIDVQSKESPYRPNSSVLKFEYNIMIYFREIIEGIVAIFAILNQKDNNEMKNMGYSEGKDIPQRFESLRNLLIENNIYFHIIGTIKRTNDISNEKNSNKNTNNSTNNRNTNAAANFITRTFTAAHTRTMNGSVSMAMNGTTDYYSAMNANINQNINTKVLVPTHQQFRPQPIDHFIENFGIKKSNDPVFKGFKSPLDEKNNIKEAIKAANPNIDFTQAINADIPTKNADNNDNNVKSKENKKNEIPINDCNFSSIERLKTVNLLLNIIIPFTKQRDANFYFYLPKIFAAIGITSFEIMQNIPSLPFFSEHSGSFYKRNEILTSISFLTSIVVSLLKGSEDIMTVFFNFIYNRTIPLLNNIADSSSWNGDIPKNLLQCIYFLLLKINEAPDFAEKDRENSENDKNINSYYSFTAIRVTLMRCMYVFMHLQTNSQITNANQFVQTLSQFHFNTNLIDNFEEFLLQITKIENFSFMLADITMFLEDEGVDDESVVLIDYKTFKNNQANTHLKEKVEVQEKEKTKPTFLEILYPPEIISRCLYFSFYDQDLGNRALYFRRPDTKSFSNTAQLNFEGLEVFDQKILKLLLAKHLSILYDNNANKNMIKKKINEYQAFSQYWANRTLTLVADMGSQQVQNAIENKQISEIKIDFYEITKRAIKKALKMHFDLNKCDSNEIEISKNKKFKTKDRKNNKNEKRKIESPKENKKTENKKNENKKNEIKDEFVDNNESLYGLEKRHQIIQQITNYAPSFYRNGYFIDIIRCCVKDLGSYFSNSFLQVGSFENSSKKLFNDIFGILQVIELLHPDTVSSIIINAAETSMKQNIVAIINDVTSYHENDKVPTMTSIFKEIITIGRTHYFRQLLNTALTMCWSHSDPAITSKRGPIFQSVNCKMALHPGNDEKMFGRSSSEKVIGPNNTEKINEKILGSSLKTSISASLHLEERKFIEKFPEILSGILCNKDVHKNVKSHSCNMKFNRKTLCFDGLEYLPNGILYAICAIYFNQDYKEAKGTESEKIIPIAISVFQHVQETIAQRYNDIKDTDSEFEKSAKQAEIMETQYFAYYFLDKVLKLSPVLTRYDVENLYTSYFLDEAEQYFKKLEKPQHINQKSSNHPTLQDCQNDEQCSVDTKKYSNSLLKNIFNSSKQKSAHSHPVDSSHQAHLSEQTINSNQTVQSKPLAQDKTNQPQVTSSVRYIKTTKTQPIFHVDNNSQISSDKINPTPQDNIQNKIETQPKTESRKKLVSDKKTIDSQENQNISKITNENGNLIAPISRPRVNLVKSVSFVNSSTSSPIINGLHSSIKCVFNSQSVDNLENIANSKSLFNIDSHVNKTVKKSRNKIKKKKTNKKPIPKNQIGEFLQSHKVKKIIYLNQMPDNPNVQQQKLHEKRKSSLEQSNESVSSTFSSINSNMNSSQQNQKQKKIIINLKPSPSSDSDSKQESSEKSRSKSSYHTSSSDAEYNYTYKSKSSSKSSEDTESSKSENESDAKQVSPRNSSSYSSSSKSGEQSTTEKSTSSSSSDEQDSDYDSEHGSPSDSHYSDVSSEAEAHPKHVIRGNLDEEESIEEEEEISDSSSNESTSSSSSDRINSIKNRK